jgi:hypothetical protein
LLSLTLVKFIPISGSPPLTFPLPKSFPTDHACGTTSFRLRSKCFLKLFLHSLAKEVPRGCHHNLTQLSYQHQKLYYSFLPIYCLPDKMSSPGDGGGGLTGFVHHFVLRVLGQCRHTENMNKRLANELAD